MCNLTTSPPIPVCFCLYKWASCGRVVAELWPSCAEYRASCAEYRASCGRVVRVLGELLGEIVKFRQLAQKRLGGHLCLGGGGPSILQCTAAKTHSELSVRYVGGASPLICVYVRKIFRKVPGIYTGEGREPFFCFTPHSQHPPRNRETNNKKINGTDGSYLWQEAVCD